KTAALRALISGNATVGNSSAASFFISPNYGEKEPDTGIRDEQCTFKPYALQRPTPFHPQYASGKPVSSTYQHQPQVSYLPVDTTPTVNAIRHTTMINIKSEEAGTMTAHERAIKPKENPYQVTTYSSFAEAAKKSPTVVLSPEEKDKEYRLKKKNAVMNKTAAVTTGTLTMANAIKAREEAEPLKTQERPPLRISIHPQRDRVVNGDELLNTDLSFQGGVEGLIGEGENGSCEQIEEEGVVYSDGVFQRRKHKSAIFYEQYGMDYQGDGAETGGTEMKGDIYDICGVCI
ncbi:MAG: hypothetical protein EZS28_034052, partial [Streblomastix strix]